jgi:hypothetical protein
MPQTPDAPIPSWQLPVAHCEGHLIGYPFFDDVPLRVFYDVDLPWDVTFTCFEGRDWYWDDRPISEEEALGARYSWEVYGPRQGRLFDVPADRPQAVDVVTRRRKKKAAAPARVIAHPRAA